MSENEKQESQSPENVNPLSFSQVSQPSGNGQEPENDSWISRRMTQFFEKGRTRLELQFLPATMEIEETPPSPIGRFTLWTLILLFIIIVIWSYIGQVDEVATASGKFIPVGRLQVVQPVESGVIRSILVSEGEVVKKGQVLINLDPSNVEVDVDGMQKRRRLLLLKIIRLEAEKASKAFRLPDEEWTKNVTQEEIQMQKRLMFARSIELGIEGLLKEKRLLLLEIARLEMEKANQAFILPKAEWVKDVEQSDIHMQTRLIRAIDAEHEARILTGRLTVQQRQSALSSNQSSQVRSQRSVDFTRQEITSIEPLVKLEAVPRERLTKLKRQLAIESQELLSQMSAVKQAQESLSESEEALKTIPIERNRAILTELSEKLHQLKLKENQLENVRIDLNRSILTELSENRQQLSLTENELAKVKQRENFIKLTSPIDGIVLKLGTYTEGGVVQPADQLVYIVPESSELVVEVWIMNRDVGFVKENMEVALKVETFPFQKYGTLPAILSKISADSTEHPQYGQVYQAIIRKLKTFEKEDPWTYTVHGRSRKVSIGMNVTAEIKTGKRRVIMFFLSPLIKTLDESVSIR